MKLKTVQFLFAFLLFVFCYDLFAQQIKIVDKPIVFDKTRANLSLAYLKDRYRMNQTSPTIRPKMIVLHWTGSNSFMGAFHTFNQATLQKNRTELTAASNLNVSAHYLVDRDGTIYRLMPDTLFARHTIGLNHCAIGIENVGSGSSALTTQQLQANERLIRYLTLKHQIEYLIGHYEYLNFKKTSLWKEKNLNYQTIKSDPGKNFMSKIRLQLKDLKLKDATTK